ncbi:uncharacterized protein LOC108198399 [Daucus carota subsp. sativus]|uniref:uncharacterized protein LOC108198399 n=1 Tax=Daucus carota subsp. sativus TaxID=79200 RepID=UPI0007EFA252|nr:PREDICTED: uncharacterized protein LOC108198399 [Daucus carota subsp. sativus]
MRIFVWHFCRNNLPVRYKLRDKGVILPITCPMCNTDVEHLLHVFFDCCFAQSCWQHVGLNYDMSEVYSAPEWLLNKLQESAQDEILKICTTLHGIWFWRNKKIWGNKTTTGAIAMGNSFLHVKEWKDAKINNSGSEKQQHSDTNYNLQKWTPPEVGMYKVNVDASWFPGAETFSIGMVLRDSAGCFIEGRSLTLQDTEDVLEAESIGVREALSWVMSRTERKVIVETDSKSTADAINGQLEYVTKVGHSIDQCIHFLRLMPDVSVKHIRKQANRVAHGLARLPCMINCFNVFTFPPTHLVEICMLDVSFE